MAPVHRAKVSVVGQPVEQRVNRRKAVYFVLRQFFEHGRQVARIGNQNTFGTRAHAQHHADRKRENMVERQGYHACGLLTCRNAPHRRLVPGFRLQHVGNNVAVQEHGPLAHARSAARVLQHGNVVCFELGFG